MSVPTKNIDKQPLGGRLRWPMMAVIGFVALIAVIWAAIQEVLSDQSLADPENAKQVAAGAEIYQAQCAECHGTNLEGQPNWQQRLSDDTMPAPPHDETGHTWHHPDQLLFDYTKLGGAAVIQAPFKSAMPGFGESLTDEDIWAVLAFIKSSWSARAREIQKQRSVQQ